MAHSHRSVRLDELVARGLCRRGSDVPPVVHAHGWSYEECCGRVVEISADGPHGAALTAAIGLVVQAQRTGEPVAWVAASGGTFFPPDADAAGVDLEALAVLRVPGPQAGGRAADKLMRSGAFGLVVLDLGDGGEAAKGLTPALQGRLHGLAARHGCALVCLTDKKAGAPSLGAAVALRVEARRRRRDGRLVCVIEALKDRRGSAGWTFEEAVDGPPGLR